MKIACVYWVHLPKHTYIAKEGYVGVAVDVPIRMKRHSTITSQTNTHFGNVIKKHGWENLVKEIIFTGDETACYELEKVLRPNFQVGWNEAIGGKGGDRSKFIDYDSRGKPIGNKKSKHGEKNPFFGKSHLDNTNQKNRIAHAKSVITTPNGKFYGFTALAKSLNVHKLTAKKIAVREGWKIEHL
jgi:hypothetical protein